MSIDWIHYFIDYIQYSTDYDNNLYVHFLLCMPAVKVLTVQYSADGIATTLWIV